MLRISKLADYGTKVLLVMVEQSDKRFTATELAASSKLPLPTVSKILKLLAKAKLLMSTRGSHGGYKLAYLPDQISLAQIVNAVDGAIAMASCEQSGCCDFDGDCELKGNWSVVSQAVTAVLQSISLQQMSQPMQTRDIPIQFISAKVAR